MLLLKSKLKTVIGDICMKSTLFFYRLGDKGLVGHCFFCIFKFFLKLCNLSVLPIVDAELYKKKTDNVELTVIEKERKGVTSNIIMAGSSAKTMLREKPIFDLRLKLFKNVCIQGNSDIVVDKNYGCVISEEAYNLEENLEIIDGLLYRTVDNVCLLRDNLRHPMVHVSAGIMISGKFCNNYYHLMYENFNKLIYLNRLDIPSGVPIVIDRQTLTIPSCKTIFDILTQGGNRPVIEIDPNKLYYFELLYCLDHINKIPSHTKDPYIHIDVLYNHNAVLKLREILLSYRTLNSFPKRIFISRSGTKRRCYNEDEVFGVLEKYDFYRFSPEEYCFEDQMALFNNAEFIVSGSGAALTNLLFINKGCKVVCFGGSTYGKICETPVFNTITNINGGSFWFFPRMNQIESNVHVNYDINCADFEEWLKQML